ncbi:TPA: multifunctional CCA tRNA nucleotidyl transferase/2'3'-cyclic phosphodiesterase/2'nucleotidase/phosphatase, partial [Candidatus Azambacteria bacterium]|nr:multifunctional CCA tRNA nucleotidyl transferase/2'3'-cyclic phosphodiesterase/2'nucleotidase/phosphatase [Candidatus Azambacteria bacterium]
LAHAANAVNVRDIVATGIQGAAIGAALQQARLDAISTAKRAWQDS